jgi:hypothetical protein
MNVLLTNRCNRRCSYCFAQERVAFSAKEDATRRAPTFIAEADFQVVVDFAARSRLGVLGVLGGEPSLHPQFLALLERAWGRGMATKVFSNGLWSEETLDDVARRVDALREPLHVVLNMNGPTRSPKDEQAAQERLLSRIGPLCSLSFNISRVDFDPSFLVDVVTAYETRPSLRLGIAQPLAQIDNEHVPVERYRELVPTLLRLAELCDAHDIRMGFDCGFTMCMFEPAELGELYVRGARFRASCGPAVDVGTDLSTWSCFPLSTFCSGQRLTDFEDLEALVRHFRSEFSTLFEAGALAECVGCRHRRRQLCSGGCGAHVYRNLAP